MSRARRSRRRHGSRWTRAGARRWAQRWKALAKRLWDNQRYLKGTVIFHHQSWHGAVTSESVCLDRLQAIIRVCKRFERSDSKTLEQAQRCLRKIHDLAYGTLPPR
jgi:hypothetical protein